MPTAPFEAHIDLKKMRSQVVFGGVGSVGALVFLFKARKTAWATDQGIEAMVPALVGLGIFVLFAGLLFKAIKALRDPNKSVVLRIDETGVMDMRVGPKTIAWSAIKKATVVDLGNTSRSQQQRNEDNNKAPIHAICLHVENAADYLKGEGALAATTKSISAATGFDEIIINPAGLDTDAHAIYEAVAIYLASHKKNR